MKITKTQLKQIIKEELSKVLEADDDSTAHSRAMGDQGFSGNAVAVDTIGNNSTWWGLMAGFSKFAYKGTDNHYNEDGTPVDPSEWAIIVVDPGVRLQLRPDRTARRGQGQGPTGLYMSIDGAEFKQADSFDHKNPNDPLRAAIEKLKSGPRLSKKFPNYQDDGKSMDSGQVALMNPHTKWRGGPWR
tara:strand:- start:88 stop:648 length:561 start_codon:yes stop_codon:yes gene_type:complete